MYKYEIHWIKTGKVETIMGENILDACAKVGYDATKTNITECILFTDDTNGYGWK